MMSQRSWRSVLLDWQSFTTAVCMAQGVGIGMANTAIQTATVNDCQFRCWGLKEHSSNCAVTMMTCFTWKLFLANCLFFWGFFVVFFWGGNNYFNCQTQNLKGKPKEPLISGRYDHQRCCFGWKTTFLLRENQFSFVFSNKKVFLRERKRHRPPRIKYSLCCSV